MAGRGTGGCGGGFSSLKPAELDVLLALSSGEMHGYGIMKDVRARSRGTTSMGPGTLYRTLDGLLGCGWVEETGEHEEGGRRRRYYRITEAGAGAAATEVDRLERIVADARRRGIPDLGFGAGTGGVR